MAENEKIKAVGYARYSSDLQRSETIAAQKRMILFYAQQNNYEILKFYVDEARSGKNADRPAFQRLIEDVKNNPEFTTVICHKLDRFSRSTVDTLQYKGMLADHGISLITVAEQLDSSPIGNMMTTVLSSVNQYYVENLANEIKKGMTENALQCKTSGGTAPTGYKIGADQRYEIVEDEAQIIRKIFELYADGYGYRQICERLQVLGVRTRQGNYFSKSGIYDIIRNEKYRGVFIFNKRAPKKFNGSRNCHKFNKDSDIIRIPNGCPAIVSEELWNRAQAMAAINKKGRSRAKVPYILSGLLYCGYCGGRLSGNHRNGSKDKAEYTTYRCCTKDNNTTCKESKEIRAEIIENYVIDLLCQYVFTDEAIEEITRQINEQLQREYSDNKYYQASKENLKVLKKSRDNLIESLAELGNLQAVKDKIKELEDQIANVEKFICAYEKNENRTLTTEDVKKQLTDIKKILKDPSVTSQVKIVLAQFIEKIEIGQEIKVTFKVAFSFASNPNKKAIYINTVSCYTNELYQYYEQLPEQIKERSPQQRLFDMKVGKYANQLVQGVRRGVLNQPKTPYRTDFFYKRCFRQGVLSSPVYRP